MLKDAKKFINALALGDGHIRKVGNSFSIQIRHCAAQKALIDFKAKRLSDFLGSMVHVSPVKQEYPAYRFEKAIPYLKYTHGWLYRNGSKYITLPFLRRLSDEGVAIWYMDDGSLARKKRRGRVHAFDLTISLYASEDEANNAITFFHERYGIIFTLKRNKGRFSIRCGTREARRLLDAIGAYIIPEMSYKTFGQEPPKAIGYGEGIVQTTNRKGGESRSGK